MGKVIARQVTTVVLTALMVSFGVFLLIDRMPGDPAVTLAGDNPSPEFVETIRDELGLDDPLLIRYFRWLGDAIQGDLGTSFSTNESVLGSIATRLPITASLMFVALLIAIAGGVFMGVLAALRPRGLLDRLVTVVASVSIAAPSFWIAIVLVYQFAVTRQVFPAIGYEPLSSGIWSWLQHLILPGLALASLTGAEVALQLRNSLVETMQRDYVITAYAKGLGTSRVVAKHAMKNAAAPVLTVLGLRIAAMLGGTVILEQIFVIPGLGSLAVTAVNFRDVPVLLGLVVLASVFVAMINLVVDTSYLYFNPRLRR